MMKYRETEDRRSRGRRRVGWMAAALMLMVAFVTGCVRMHVAMEFYGDDTADVSMVMIDKTGMLFGMSTCADFATEMGAGATEFTIEEIVDDQGRNGCEMTSERVPITTMSASGELSDFGPRREGNLFVISSDAVVTEQDLADLPGLEVSMSFTFPGQVVEAGNGTVSNDGRTVTFTGSQLYSDIYVEGEASGSGFSGSGFPIWLAVVIAAVAAGGLALVLVLARRGGRGRGQHPGWAAPATAGPGPHPQFSVPPQGYGQHAPGGYPPASPPPQQTHAGQPSGGHHPAGPPPAGYGHGGAPLPGYGHDGRPPAGYGPSPPPDSSPR